MGMTWHLTRKEANVLQGPPLRTQDDDEDDRWGWIVGAWGVVGVVGVFGRCGPELWPGWVRVCWSWICVYVRVFVGGLLEFDKLAGGGLGVDGDASTRC